MSLFSELAVDVDEILSDPNLATADVKIRRASTITPGSESYEEPIITYQVIRMSAVVFTRQTRRSDFNGSLVTQKVDEVTASAYGFVIEEDNVAVAPRKILITDILSTDEFLIDGDVREITQIVRIPAAGPAVTAWQVQVLH